MRHFTRALTRTSAALACAALATCADAPTGPSRSGMPVRLALAPQFSASASTASSALRQAGIEVASVRVVIRRTSNGDELFNKLITVAPGASSVTLEADVLLRSAEEELTAFMEFLDAAGTVLYRGEQRVVARAGNDNSVTVDTEIEFVGPGATAATVRVTPADTTISTATPITLQALALDAAGTAIAAPILLWSSSDATLATVSATGLVTPLGPRGSVQVTARTPLGIAGAATLRLMPPAARIVVVGGSGQVGTAGTTLAQPFTVEVQAADGLPVAGETVTFSAVTAGGSVTTATATTDAQGRASTPFKLGSAVGRYEFRAISGSLGAVTISADASAGTASAMAILSGDGQSAPVGTALGAPLVVKVKDTFGNPVAGAKVKWQVLSGTGTLSAVTSTSDASGHAGVAYTVGNAPATESVKATLDGTTVTATFTVTAALGAASQIAIVSGDAQTGDEGSLLPSAIVVQVKDALGNPVPGAAVTWSVTSGNATLAQATSVTDANAKASNTVTLGNPAVMPASVVIKAALASGASVTFGATIVALPPVPSQLKVVSQPSSAAVGAVMSPPFSVRIADAAGVSIAQPGVSVTASVYAPSASVAPVEKGGMSAVTTTMRELVGTTTVTTDASGTATFADLALTGSVGEVQVAFSATGLTGAVSSSITLVAGSPQAISVVSGDAQSGEEGTVLASPLVVIVTDAAGNATPGAAVTWAVTSGNATLAQATTTTDAASKASNTVTLGSPATMPATAVITATIASGVSVTFNATITPAPLVAAKLVITQQPSAGAIGVMLAPSYRIQVADESGEAVPQAGVVVQAALRVPVLAAIPLDSAPRRAARSASMTERTLIGTLSVATNAAGIAEFGDLSVTGATGTVEIEFAAPGLAGVTSTALALAHGPVAAVTIKPAMPDGLLTAYAGSPVQENIWAATVDASGNHVANVPLEFSVRADSPEGTEVTTGAGQSDANGTLHASLFPVPADVGTYYIRIAVAQTSIPVAVVGVQVVPPPSPTLVPVPAMFDPIKDTVQTVEELSVVLTDAGGAPIPNASITWKMPGEPPLQGARAPTPVRASANGNFGTQPAFSVAASTSSYVQPGFVVNGIVEHSAVTSTDAGGTAKVQFSRGITAGVVGLTVEAGDYALSAPFPVEVAAGQPYILRIERAPSASAQAGVVLAQQPIVSLRDIWGNAVKQAGVPITAWAQRWYRSEVQVRASLQAAPVEAASTSSVSCPDCEGPQYLVGTTTVTTDANGQATFTDLALGAPVDSYSIVYMNEQLGLYGEYPNGCGAECGEVPVELSAGPAARWHVVPDDDAPLVGASVRVWATLHDAWQNPITDAKERAVTWAASPAGEFAPSSSVTLDGRDSTMFTVSTTPGTDHLVTISHVEPDVGTISGSTTITAVQTVAAAVVQPIEGDNQVVAPGVPLAPITVRVMDFQGMPVPSATVRWSARRAASYSDAADYTYPASSLTDSAGYATSPQLTLPSLENRTGFVVQAQVLHGGEGSPYTSFRAVTLLPGYTHAWLGPKVGTHDGAAAWHTASFWNTGTVPTASSNVIIPDFDAGEWSYPTLAADASVGDLHSYNDWGSAVDIGTQKLTIGGSLYAMYVYGSGTVELTGVGKTAEADVWDARLHVANGATITASGYLAAQDLVVNGRLEVTNDYVYVYDSLLVEGAGATLAANHRDASITAYNVVFDGAAMNGSLANGELSFRTSFRQGSTWSATSFTPGVNFSVYTYAPDSATIAFQSPGAAGSYFSYIDHYYGFARQLTPMYVASALHLSADWSANGLTAERASVENGGKLFIAGSSNLIRRLTLEFQSTLNTARDSGTVTVEQCENYGAYLEGLTLDCTGISSMRASLSTIGEADSTEDAGTRRTPRAASPRFRTRSGDRSQVTPR